MSGITHIEGRNSSRRADNVQPRAAVWAIVLTHGGAEAVTAECLDSLLSQDYNELTILLVDNNSFDGSGARLRQRYPRIEYLNTGDNYGYTGGNNRGMDYALRRGADHLMVLNNDTVLDPECVSQLVAVAISRHKVGAVAPKILLFDDPRRIWYAGGDLLQLRAIARHRGESALDDASAPGSVEEVSFATGCCFLMPAEVARRVGTFREDFFMYCEDVDLSLRLKRAGLRIYYQPAARLLHREHHTTTHPTPFQIFQRDRNRRRLVRQHYRLAQRLAFAAWFYPTRLLRLAQYAVRGDWSRAGAVIRGATAG